MSKFLENLREGLKLFRDMRTANKAAGVFGRAARARDRGRIEAAHDAALEALTLVYSPDVKKETGSAIAVIIQATLLLDDVCKRLGRPPPAEMIRRAQSTLAPLSWVPKAEREAIAALASRFPELA